MTELLFRIYILELLYVFHVSFILSMSSSFVVTMCVIMYKGIYGHIDFGVFQLLDEETVSFIYSELKWLIPLCV